MQGSGECSQVGYCNLMVGPHWECLPMRCSRPPDLRQAKSRGPPRKWKRLGQSECKSFSRVPHCADSGIAAAMGVPCWRETKIHHAAVLPRDFIKLEKVEAQAHKVRRFVALVQKACGGALGSREGHKTRCVACKVVCACSCSDRLCEINCGSALRARCIPARDPLNDSTYGPTKTKFKLNCFEMPT